MDNHFQLWKFWQLVCESSVRLSCLCISATDPTGRGPGPESQPTEHGAAPELAQSADPVRPVPQRDQRPWRPAHQDRQSQNTQPGWK